MRPFLPLAGLALLAACAGRHNFADRVESPSFPEFTAKVKQYTELVDKLDKDLGKLPDRSSPETINAHRRALAEAIRRARPNAQPGDIFTAAERPAFARTVRSEIKGKEGAPARKTIAEDNPKGKPEDSKASAQAPPVKLAVNAIYPDGAPRSTVPPTLLLRMPKIPETLEFRFVGKALVLYDARANLIVDFIPDALP
jgi:hypothetical protein